MCQIKEHTCDVVRIKLENHPNADALSIVHVKDFQCVVKTSDWKDGELAVYIPPDSVVPNTKPFDFLNGNTRIKARRLRGEWSMGLLVPAPDGAKVGDDYMEWMGITHYDPPIKSHFSTGGDNTNAPPGFIPKYDVLNFRKYAQVFQDGEEVVVTEKIHGANTRFVCHNDQMFCGSRNNWKKEDPNNLWWKALNQNPALEAWLRRNQDYVVYGEIFGNVQSLKYGATNGQIFFAVFDIMKNNQWLDYDEAHEIGKPLTWVPLVFRGPFNKEQILEFAEGDSIWPEANHHAEGVVVKPVKERTERKIGRVQLKVVGNRYLSKS